LHQQQIELISQAIEQKESLLIIGEQGSGKSTVANSVKASCQDTFKGGIAVVSYSGSIKPFLLSIGRQLKIELTKPKINSKGEEVGETPMSVDEMKEEIGSNLFNKLLIIDDAHRLPTSLKLWIEEVHKEGNQLLLFSITDAAKGIFLRLGKVELPAPTELQIRDLMQREAITLNLSLSPSRLAALQRRTGKNLMLAKKVIRDESLGISSGVEHRDYVDISPFIMAGLAGLAVVRFIGLGLGDRTLYIVGGVAMVISLMLKYLARGLTRNRKRLGT
jgi:energy-coupling factor transporter ATP-binding protein EcfA2